MPGKSAHVKNEKQYEALKDKGMSKERAAKIANSPDAVATAIDRAVLEMTAAERRHRELSARRHAMQFDRMNVFDRLMAATATPTTGERAVVA